jgi:eukaryotic-like serine/threonine-protein kinase
LLQRAETLAKDFPPSGIAKRVDSEYAHGFIALSRSICSFLVGDWSKSRTLAGGAERFFKTRPEGAMWELASARTFGLWSHFYLGDFAQLAERVSDFIQEAETRGDRYAATLHRTGLVTMVWLANDEPQFARRQVMAAETGWSRTIFDFQRYLNTLGHCLVDHYVGAPELAHRRMTEIWPRLRVSQYLRIQNLRFEALYLRGIFALAAATNGDAPQLLNDAMYCAKRILREDVAWSNALGNLLSGGICEARGQTEEAAQHWRLAEQQAARHDMTLFAAAAAYRLEVAGKAAPGNDATRYSTLQAIREPERVCLMFAPGKRVQAQRTYPALGLRGRGTS